MVANIHFRWAIFVVLLGLSFWAGRASHVPQSNLTDRAKKAPSILINLSSFKGGETLGGNSAEENHHESESKERIPIPVPEVIREKLLHLAGNEAHEIEQTNLRETVARDAPGAIDYLAQGESLEMMLRWLVQLWSKKDPETASAWLLDNQGRQHYDAAVEGLTQGIASKNPESAMGWAKIITDPVIKTRVWTAAGYQQYRHDSRNLDQSMETSDSKGGKECGHNSRGSDSRRCRV